MTWLLLSTGHVWEVAEAYAPVTTAIKGGSEGEFTVQGAKMFFRYEHIIGVANTYDQVHVITLGVDGKPAVP